MLTLDDDADAAGADVDAGDADAVVDALLFNEVDDVPSTLSSGGDNMLLDISLIIVGDSPLFSRESNSSNSVSESCSSSVAPLQTTLLVSLLECDACFPPVGLPVVPATLTLERAAEVVGVRSGLAVSPGLRNSLSSEGAASSNPGGG